MKEKIHPASKIVEITCACGAKFETTSVKDNIRVEICSSCHPLFTGQEKLIDTAGRIDRFNKKYSKAKKKK